MHLSEKEVEDFIFDDLYMTNGKECLRRGLQLSVSELTKENKLYTNTKWFRQINLGSYGILDIVGVYRYRGVIFVELIELKVVPIESVHFEQILRYKEGIKRFLKPQLRVNFECYIVGPSIKDGHYIHNNLDVSVIEYEYNLSGLRFKNHGPFPSWYEIDEKPIDLLKHLRNG